MELLNGLGLGLLCLIPGISIGHVSLSKNWIGALSGLLISVIVEGAAPRASGNEGLLALNINDNFSNNEIKEVATAKIVSLMLGLCIGFFLPWSIRGGGHSFISLGMGVLFIFLIAPKVKSWWMFLLWAIIISCIGLASPRENGALFISSAVYIIPGVLRSRRIAATVPQMGTQGDANINYFQGIIAALVSSIAPGISPRVVSMVLNPLPTLGSISSMIIGETMLEGLAIGNLQKGASGKSIVAPLIGANQFNLGLFILVVFLSGAAIWALLTLGADKLYKSAPIITQIISSALNVGLLLILNPLNALICIGLGFGAYFVAEKAELPIEANSLVFLSIM